MWNWLKEWWYGAHTAVVGSQSATNTLLAILIVLAGVCILGIAYLAVNPIGGTTLDDVPFDQRGGGLEVGQE